MKAAVSDTSPLNYLALIGCVDVLPQLFSSLAIPPAVHRELLHARTPPEVRRLATQLPAWLDVRMPRRPFVGEGLDAGESEAIALALELEAGTLLLDDSLARVTASRLGLRPMGVIGVLVLAGRRGLVDLPGAASRLRKTNFVAAESLWTRLAEPGPKP